MSEKEPLKAPSSPRPAADPSRSPAVHTRVPPPFQLSTESPSEEVAEQQKQGLLAAAGAPAPPNGPNGNPIQRQVIQRDDPDADDGPTLPEGKDFTLEGSTFTFRRAWVVKNATEPISGKTIKAPKVMQALFLELKAQGYLSWVSNKDIEQKAKEIPLRGPLESPPIITRHLAGFWRLIDAFGLPPGEKILINFLDDGMMIHVDSKSVHTASAEDHKALSKLLLNKMEEKTGLKLKLDRKEFEGKIEGVFAAWKKEGKSKSGRTISDYIKGSTCENMFGEAEWQAFQNGLEDGVGTKAGGATGDGKSTGDGKGTKGKGGTRKFKSKPPWASKLQRELDALGLKAKSTEPKAEDIPDKFYVYCFEDSDQWRVQGTIEGPPQIKQFQKVDATSDAATVFQRIRLKVQSARVDRELKEAQGSKAKELDKEDLWAEALRLKIWAQMRTERAKQSRQTQLNFPDALSLQVIKEGDSKRHIYLVVHVRVAKKEGEGGEQAAGFEIRGARLPQPMAEGMPIDATIKQIKDIAFALRNPDKVVDSSNDSKKPLPDIVHEAFPAYISPDNMRADFQTVTGGQHEFYMALKYSTWYKPGVESFGEAWTTSYTRWKLYKIDDQFTIPKGEGDKDNSTQKEWPGKRQQLQAYFEGKKENIASVGGLSAVESYKSSVHPDRDITIPSKEGTYLLYAHTQIKPSEKRYIKPSHAVFVLKARDGYKLAHDETNKRLKDIGTLDEKMKSADGLQQLFIGAELNRLKEEEKAAGSVSLFSSTEKSVASLEEKLAMLPQLKAIAKKKESTPDKSVPQLIFETYGEAKFKAYHSFWKEIERFPPNWDSPLRKIPNVKAQLEKGLEQMRYFRKKILPYRQDFAANGVIYNPVSTIASEYTGKTHRLTLMLGEAKDSGISTRKFVLIDVSNPNQTEKYSGSGSSKEAAIKAAFEDFAANNDYGDGYLSFRVPGILPTHQVRNRPGIKKRALQILKGVALVGGIAALAIATVATGGTALAAVGTALGVAAGVAGAIVAVDNIQSRVENHRFEWDAETALDILAIIGGVTAVVGSLGTFVKSAKALQAVGQTGWRTKVLSSLPGWVQRVDSLEGILVLHSTVDLAGNAIFVPIKLRDDLAKIDGLNLDPKVKAAMKEQAIQGAMLSGFMLVAGGISTAKGAKDYMQQKRQLALGKKEAYVKAMQDAGVLDADGNVIGAKDATADATVPKADGDAPASKGEGEPTAPKESEIPKQQPEPAGTPDKVPAKPKPSSPDGGNKDGLPPQENGGHNGRPPKGPDTPSGGDGGTPPAPQKKEWDDPLLTETEFGQGYKQAVKNPKKSGAELDTWLQGKFRKGERYNPQTSRWSKPFKNKGAYRTRSRNSRNQNTDSFIGQNRAELEAGSNKALEGLLERHGVWKELVLKLGGGSTSDKIIAKQLGWYRDRIVGDIIQARFGADKAKTLDGASTKPESDIDLNFYGPDAGKNMLQAEAQMKAIFGPEWSEKLRMNFYTDPGRLGRAAEVSSSMTAPQKQQTQAELTALTEKFAFAKMLKHAGRNKASQARVKELVRGAGLDLGDVQRIAKMTSKQMETKRQALNKEIDVLETQYASATGKQKVKLGVEITKKQMEINLYSTEAYIGPGAGKQLSKLPLDLDESYQSMLSQWEMIEHVIHESGGDIVKAMREYEIYKYLQRFSDANSNKQLDLIYDALTQKISKLDRQAAKNFSEEQIHSLWKDFQNFASHALKQKKIGLVIKGGGTAGSLTKSWNDPSLTAPEMIAKYRAAGVKSKDTFTDAELKEKFDRGLRFDDDTRQWRTPFKHAASGTGKTKELNFSDVAGLKPVQEDAKIPATMLGLDQTRADKLKPYLDLPAVNRIQSAKTVDQVKGQIAEEVANKIGIQQAAATEPKLDGQVEFFHGGQVAGPAPTGGHKGADKAPLTDGMVAELSWKGQSHDKADLYIHQIHEVKSGHASADGAARQVGWDIERIKELGLYLEVTIPGDASTPGSRAEKKWMYFPPESIKMRPRSEQTKGVSVFTPTDVHPAKGNSTQGFTAKNLPGLSAEDLHLAALLVMQKRAAPASEQLPLFPDNTPAQRSIDPFSPPQGSSPPALQRKAYPGPLNQTPSQLKTARPFKLTK